MEEDKLVKAFEEDNVIEMVKLVRTRLMDVPTDKGYIKLKPGGGNTLFPYVPYSYMDNRFKLVYPLYEMQLLSLDVNWSTLWVWAVVTLREKVSHNQEIGVGAARIQLKRGDKSDGTVDASSIIDFDKNIKSAVTNAIKNAESRFGVCADVYQKSIVPSEILQAWEEEYMSILHEHVTNPIQKQKLIDRWKTFQGNKRELLEDIKEEFKIISNEGETQ